MRAQQPSSSFNVARFDLVSIRLAVACAQSGSLSAAARDCHLALAAASRRIRELEAALGSTLFHRHARGLTPTAAGRLLVKHGLALQQTTEQLGRELADERQGVARHLRLCAGSAAISQFLPPLLARYAALHPQVHIELEEQVSAGVAAALREGRADVGVFVNGPDTTGLHVLPFRTDELVLLLPAAHPLASPRPRRRAPGQKQATPSPAATKPAPALALSTCLDENWISLGSGAALLQTLQASAHAADRALRLRMQVHSFDAMCHLVAAGLGVALLPRQLAEAATQTLPVAWRALTDPWAHRQLWVATHSEDAAALALAQFLAAPVGTQLPKPAAKPTTRRQVADQ